MRSTCSECSEDRNKDRNIGTQSIFHASPFPRTRATHQFSSLAFDCFLIMAYSLAQLDFSLAFVGYFIPPRPRRQSTDHTNFCHESYSRREKTTMLDPSNFQFTSIAIANANQHDRSTSNTSNKTTERRDGKILQKTERDQQSTRGETRSPVRKPRELL